MIWSYIIIFRPPEHKKHHLNPKWDDLILPPFMYTFRDIATYGTNQGEKMVKNKPNVPKCPLFGPVEVSNYLREGIKKTVKKRSG